MTLPAGFPSYDFLIIIQSVTRGGRCVKVEACCPAPSLVSSSLCSVPHQSASADSTQPPTKGDAAAKRTRRDTNKQQIRRIIANKAGHTRAHKQNRKTSALSPSSLLSSLISSSQLVCFTTGPSSRSVVHSGQVLAFCSQGIRQSLCKTCKGEHGSCATVSFPSNSARQIPHCLGVLGCRSKGWWRSAPMPMPLPGLLFLPPPPARAVRGRFNAKEEGPKGPMPTLAPGGTWW